MKCRKDFLIFPILYENISTEKNHTFCQILFYVTAFHLSQIISFNFLLWEISAWLSRVKETRDFYKPLVISFITRSIFILPSCQNRHRTHRSVNFYFTVLSEPSQDSLDRWRRTSLFSLVSIYIFWGKNNLFLNYEAISVK